MLPRIPSADLIISCHKLHSCLGTPDPRLTLFPRSPIVETNLNTRASLSSPQQARAQPEAYHHLSIATTIMSLKNGGLNMTPTLM
jgi:hypothetical protein